MKDGAQKVVLDSGTRYEGTAMLRDFRITDFVDYSAIIGHKSAMLDPNNADQASMSALWHSQEPSFRAEFHWRLTLVFSVIVMALMVVPLSVVNPRQGGCCRCCRRCCCTLSSSCCRAPCAPTAARTSWTR